MEYKTENDFELIPYMHFGEHHQMGNFVVDPTGKVLLISRQKLSDLFTQLNEAKRRKLLIVHDEAHELGSQGHRDRLAGEHARFPYRLGLTATSERNYDEVGNEFITQEIGEVMFEFPLDNAIERGVLCEFDYIPIEYALTEDDKNRIGKLRAWRARQEEEGNPMSDEEFAIALAKIYKTAEAKPSMFSEHLAEHRGGAGDLVKNTVVFVETMEYGDKILPIIENYTNRYKTYYSGADQLHLQEFADGVLDCLITCHRLSQGIDLPKLENVILFSSSKGKLETIQRMGRCLRIDPDNSQKRAQVVDFVRINPVVRENPTTDQKRREWLEALSETRRRTEQNTIKAYQNASG